MVSCAEKNNILWYEVAECGERRTDIKDEYSHFFL